MPNTLHSDGPLPHEKDHVCGNPSCCCHYGRPLPTITDIIDHPHRWNGWPGAMCQDCHVEDQRELCLAGVHRPVQFQQKQYGKDAQMLGDHMCVNPPCTAPNPGFPSDHQEVSDGG